MNLKWHVTVLFSVLLILTAPIAASGRAEDPSSQYRVLEWNELVPEGWEPPLVPKSYDEVGAASIDKTSVVAELEKQLVAIAGFMKPVAFEGNSVSEFLLVPFLPHHTRQHRHLEANQKVYVYLLNPLQVDNPMIPIWVVGAITLESVMTNEGPAAYRIIDGVTTEYEY